MTKQEEDKIMEEAIETWGSTSQLIKTVEECSELSVALLHFQSGKVDYKAVLSELADVEIMVTQMKKIIGNEKEFEEVKEQKLQRVRTFLDEWS